jgi:hypothetical protein
MTGIFITPSISKFWKNHIFSVFGSAAHTKNANSS